MKDQLLLRTMVAAADPTQALALQARLMRRLQAWAPQAERPPERYWKIPQWVELTLGLAPATPASVDQLLAMQTQGWSVYGDEYDRSAVWNAAPGVVWLLPELQWAELILTLRPDADQDDALDASPETAADTVPGTPPGAGGG
jgi:hypothetical protein